MNVDDVVSSLFDEFRKSLEPKVTELFNNYQLYKETYEAVAKIPFVKSLIDSQKKSENPSFKILHPSPNQQINLEIIDDTTESSPPNLESIADYINTMTQNSFQPFNRIHLDENTTDNIEDYEKEYQEDEEDEDEKDEDEDEKDEDEDEKDEDEDEKDEDEDEKDEDEDEGEKDEDEDEKDEEEHENEDEDEKDEEENEDEHENENENDEEEENPENQINEKNPEDHEDQVDQDKHQDKTNKPNKTSEHENVDENILKTQELLSDTIIEKEKEEEEEYYVVKIKGKLYVTMDELNGDIHEYVNEEVGEKVGTFKNGVAKMQKNNKLK